MTDIHHDTVEWAAHTASDAGIEAAHAFNALYNPAEEFEGHDPVVQGLLEAAGLLIGEGSLGSDALVVKNSGAERGYTTLLDLLPPPSGQIKVINNVLDLRAKDLHLFSKLHRDRYEPIRHTVDQAVTAIIEAMPWGKTAREYGFYLLHDRDDLVVAYGGQGVPLSKKPIGWYTPPSFNPCEEGVDEQFTITIGEQELDMRAGMTRGVYQALSDNNEGFESGLDENRRVRATVITGERTPRNGYWLGSRYLEFEQVTPEELQGSVPYEENHPISIVFRPAVVLRGMAQLTNLK